MNRWIACLLVLACGCLVAGCGSSKPAPIPVTGTVKLSQGSLPEGEISVIRFEPITPGPDIKAASGDIAKDGTFKLTTLKPGDGAYPGDYKVVFSVWKTYIGREELLAPQFTKSEETPLTAKVAPGSQKFDFTVELKQ